MEKGMKFSAKLDSPPMDESMFNQLVGSLIYLTTKTWSHFFVNYISHFMAAPKSKHWVAAKHVLWYVKATSNFGILYGEHKDPRLIGFTYSDWATSTDDRKSTPGYVFSLGISAITWTGKK